MTRRTFLAASGGAAAAASAQTGGSRYNVLFLAVDDMRPDLGCYGNRYVQTPHLDKLAARGLTFTRAYCQQAVCSPSRTSLLTGRRPDTTAVYDLQTHFRKNLPDVVTLPQHFRANGYVTTGLSKIYHPGLDDYPSWSVPSWAPGVSTAWNTPENAARCEREWELLRQNGWRFEAPRTTRAERGPAWQMRDVADTELPDGRTADMAIRALGELKGKPFFLAAGFLKPHLPFTAPKKYFDLYPKEKVQIPDYRELPKGVPEIALHRFGELRNYSDIPETGDIDESKALELVRAYYAALSYTDAQIGRVLDALKRLGLEENTVVVVWGDHGYHLGDHGLWNKHSNFEKAVRSPLIISVPGQRSAGRKTAALTEFVDVYPSLSQICGLPRPEGLEGISFAPLLERPNRSWKAAAFSQYPRGKSMGYSMRTDRYRYTEWGVPGTDEKAYELYDYLSDPDERVNLAAQSENAAIVKDMAARLKAGWRAAMPDS